jgi:hypothetical protein
MAAFTQVKAKRQYHTQTTQVNRRIAGPPDVHQDLLTVI